MSANVRNMLNPDIVNTVMHFAFLVRSQLPPLFLESRFPSAFCVPFVCPPSLSRTPQHLVLNDKPLADTGSGSLPWHERRFPWLGAPVTPSLASASYGQSSVSSFSFASLVGYVEWESGQMMSSLWPLLCVIRLTLPCAVRLTIVQKSAFIGQHHWPQCSW